MKNRFIAHKRKNTDEDQLLSTHLTEVAELAAGFAEKLGLTDAGRLLGLLHDFGKYSHEFQNYIQSATGGMDQDDENWVDARLLKGKIDHSSAGAQFIWNRFSGAGQYGQGDLVGQVLALCIASHHSGLIDCFDINNKAKFKQRMDKADGLTHLEECRQNADKALFNRIEHLASAQLCSDIFKRMRSVSQDNPAKWSKIDWFHLGFFTRFLFSTLIDADRLNSAEFETPSRKQERCEREQYFDWGTAAERIEGFIGALKPSHPIDGLRRDISDQCRQKAQGKQGIYTLTIPTGGGKTYASLRYALHHAAQHRLDRIIYILPYTSIIEQNAKEVRKAIEREGDRFPWVLEQHSNLEPDQQTWRSKLIAENWDSPIVLTTMVQFLETCFAGGTRSVRRLHQLANSIIIFDEIQTLPINCVHLFCNALNFLSAHCSTTALLCTATQPLLNELKNKAKGALEIPAENEIASDVADLFEKLHRVDVDPRIKTKGWQPGEVAALALGQFAETQSCLVIVNTKSWAQDLYQACQDALPKEALFHLSTHQCPAHRKHWLDKIRRRLQQKKPVLCFSTQLIEAGVDISFARVIRFLAGLDSIAQAAGRCNRHGEAEKGQVLVINPAEETTGLLKEIEAGKDAARRVLDEGFGNLVAPAAMRQYFKYYFHERADDMDYRLDDRQIGRSDSLLNLLSDNEKSQATYTDRWQQQGKIPLLSQSFMEAGKQFKAIDAPTEAVIVPFGEGKKIITALCGVDAEFNAEKYYELIRQAQSYSVNVFPNVWKKLRENNAIHEIQPGLGIYHLDKRYYSADFGLSDQPVALMENYNL